MEMWLIGLLVGSNVFWAIQMHRLINKLMSRSLHEYLDAVHPKPKVKKQDLEHEPILDDNLASVNEIFS